MLYEANIWITKCSYKQISYVPFKTMTETCRCLSIHFASCLPSLVWEYRPIRNATLRRVVIRQKRRIRFDGRRIYEFVREVCGREVFRYGSEGWPVRSNTFLVSFPAFESHFSQSHHGCHRRKGGDLSSGEVE